MTLQQIAYFIAVAENGSIKKAAEALQVKRTTLLMSLTALEKELGVSLLIRGNRGSGLSAKSRALYDIAKQIQQETSHLLALKEQWQHENALTLYWDSPTMFSLLAKVNSVYLDQHPAVDLNMLRPEAHTATHPLSMTKADFVFSTTRYENDAFSAYPLFTSPYAVCVNPDHPLRHVPLIDYKKLDRTYPLIVFAESRFDALEAGRFPLQLINNLEALQRIIFISDCLAFVPQILITKNSLVFERLITVIPLINFPLQYQGFLFGSNQSCQKAVYQTYLSHILNGIAAWSMDLR